VRAAIYSRFSTDKQSESTIADKVRVCTERADKYGYTITHRFEDWVA
jgi:site-specific DNA recombinase